MSAELAYLVYPFIKPAWLEWTNNQPVEHPEQEVSNVQQFDVTTIP